MSFRHRPPSDANCSLFGACLPKLFMSPLFTICVLLQPATSGMLVWFMTDNYLP